ncbi:MAG: hypothetical protein CMI55_03735 [Parcubacteria group bacterium]|jgi:predicted nucleotidyltransferase component of viral defense system|nr:hypothetical protein [Parcubacteria group bacterium]|tara:strand:- start:119 stop:796 length:678 start_codon:yes stop_codon:yes gene_type:complete
MPEIKLNKLQIDILSFWEKDNFAHNFYWTGGTLLAFKYLKHRKSIDLDFFSDNLFTNDEYLSFINRLKKVLNCQKITMTLSYNRRQYLITRKLTTAKLELVYFPFAKIEDRKMLEQYSVKTDSLTDIMVNKILSTYQRNEVKDIYDLYFYFKNKPKYNLQKLTKLVETKFGVSIEPILLLSKINKLTNNLDSITPLLLQKPKNLTEKIKLFFQKEFNKIAREKIK